jgi:hypothetical protein
MEIPGAVKRAAGQLGGGVATALVGGAPGRKKPVGPGVLTQAQEFLRGVYKQAPEGVARQAVGAAGKGVSGVAQGVQGVREAGNLSQLGYGAMGASLIVAGALGAAAGVAASRQSEEKRQRMAGDKPIVGGNVMPADLQAGYLNLAIPGSPLGGMGLLAGNHLRQGQAMQDALVAQQHRMKDAMVSYRGQLPLSYQTSEED